MKLRRWRITVMDNWTPTREFFTLRAALNHRARHFPVSYLYHWESGRWVDFNNAYTLMAYLNDAL